VENICHRCPVNPADTDHHTPPKPDYRRLFSPTERHAQSVGPTLAIVNAALVTEPSRANRARRAGERRARLPKRADRAQFSTATGKTVRNVEAVVHPGAKHQPTRDALKQKPTPGRSTAVVVIADLGLRTGSPAQNRYQSFIESSAIRPASLVMFRVGTRHRDSPLIHRFPRFGFALSPKLEDATVSDDHFQVESHAFPEVEQISREGGCVAGKVTVIQKLSTRDKSVACHPVIGHGAIERLCLPVLSRQVFGEQLEILRKLECIVHPRARLRWC